MEYDVKDFGAVGDGVTDDTAAIQKAFDTVGKAGGGIIRIPGKTYKVTGMLRIMYSNITVIGESGNKLEYHGVGAPLVKGRIDRDTTGEQFNGKETGLFLLIMGPNSMPDMIHDIVIKNVNFDGTHQDFKGGATEDDLKTTSIKPYYRSGITAIRPQCVYFLKIEGCKLIDFYGNGIAADRCSHVEIVDNYLEDCSGNGFGHGMAGDCFGDGIGCWKSSHCYVARNFVYNRRTFLTHEISCNRDVYGYPCGRSGLEFEYPANIDVWGNPECWTPLHLNAEIDPSSYNLTFEQNVVYGYTKGCHLENGVNCRILNNTFVYNHISFLDATGGNTIVKGNYFDPAGINSSVQGGYDWYGRCGVALTHFLGTEYNNPVIDGNIFVGDQTAIQLGRNRVSIKNNIFRLTGGAGIGRRITVHDIAVTNNEFNAPVYGEKAINFIGIDGTNNKIIGNTFTGSDKAICELGSSMSNGSIIANNTFYNTRLSGYADVVEGNMFNIVNKDEKIKRISMGGIGSIKQLNNNVFKLTGVVLSLCASGIVESNRFIFAGVKDTEPCLSLWDSATKNKVIIRDNYIDSDKALNGTFISLDGRVSSTAKLDVTIEDNYVNNFTKNFKLFSPYRGSKYKNFTLRIKYNYPNTYDLKNSTITPLAGNYYRVGDTVDISGLVCIKEGWYSGIEWKAENKYSNGNFVVHEGTVYKCITKEKELQSEVKPSGDTVNWQSFGKVAEFKNE